MRRTKGRFEQTVFFGIRGDDDRSRHELGTGDCRTRTGRWLSPRDSHLSFGLPSGELDEDLASDSVDVHAFTNKRRTRDAGEAEEIVNELGHALSGRTHPFERVPSLRVELARVLAEEDFTESVDRPQRSLRMGR
jgi:hypothetical protein